MTDLKPCPFCGEAERLDDVGSVVACHGCHICGPNPAARTGVTDRSAAEAWNTRPSPWKLWSEERPKDGSKLLVTWLAEGGVASRIAIIRGGFIGWTNGYRRVLVEFRDPPPAAQWAYLSEVLP